MKKLVIYRKRQFPSALMPYWIISTISKSEFIKRYQLLEDVSDCDEEYRKTDLRREFIQEYGVPILNGKTLELEIDERIKSVFAVTIDGLLSNEVLLNPDLTPYQILVTTKGGWRTPSYPQLTLHHT